MDNIFINIYEQNTPFAVTDRDMNIVFANSAFGNLMGQNMFHPVYKLLDEADGKQLASQAVALAKEERVSLLMSVHAEEGFHPAIIDVEGRGDGNLNMWIQDIFWMKERLKENRVTVQKYRACLVLEEDIYFEYHRSTDEFSMFWLKDEQMIFFHKGTLAGFARKMIEGARIVQTDISLFKEFCKDLRSGIAEFHYEISTNMLENISTMEPYRIKGRVLGGKEDMDITVGICTRYDRMNKAKQDTMLAEMYIDPLTGVMKKEDFEKYATQLFLGKPEGTFALCLLDIDYFKSVNDTYGHKYGDSVLRLVGEILKKAVGTNGIPARIGGDEFAVVLDDITDELQIRNVLRTMRSGFQWMDPGKLEKLHFGCSMGVSRYPQDGGTYEELFQVADNALYLAKLKGRNRYIIYEEDKHGELVKADNAISVLQTSFTSFSGVEFGRRLASLFLDGKDNYKQFLDYLLGIYEIDRIRIYWQNMEKPLCEASKRELPGRRDAAYALTESFGKLIAEKQYLYLPMIFQMEYTHPDLYAAYKESGIETTFQFVFKDGKGEACGLLSMDKCVKHVNWSSDTINNFVTVGAAFERLLTAGTERI